MARRPSPVSRRRTRRSPSLGADPFVQACATELAALHVTAAAQGPAALLGLSRAELAVARLVATGTDQPRGGRRAVRVGEDGGVPPPQQLHEARHHLPPSARRPRRLSLQVTVGHRGRGGGSQEFATQPAGHCRDRLRLGCWDSIARSWQAVRLTASGAGQPAGGLPAHLGEPAHIGEGGVHHLRTSNIKIVSPPRRALAAALRDRSSPLDQRANGGRLGPRLLPPQNPGSKPWSHPGDTKASPALTRCHGHLTSAEAGDSASPRHQLDYGPADRGTNARRRHRRLEAVLRRPRAAQSS